MPVAPALVHADVVQLLERVPEAATPFPAGEPHGTDDAEAAWREQVEEPIEAEYREKVAIDSTIMPPMTRSRVDTRLLVRPLTRLIAALQRHGFSRENAKTRNRTNVFRDFVASVFMRPALRSRD